MVLRSRWAADRGRRKQAVGGGLLEGNCVAVQRTAGRRGMVPQCGMDKTAPAQRKIPTAERGRPVADQRERAVCSGKRRPAAAGRAATAVRRGHEADKKVMRDYCSAFLPFAAQTTAICRAGLLKCSRDVGGGKDGPAKKIFVPVSGEKILLPVSFV